MVVLCAHAFDTTTGKKLRLEERRALVKAKQGRSRKDFDSSDNENKSPSVSKLKYMQNPPTTLIRLQEETADLLLPPYADGKATDTDTSEPSASASPVRHVAHVCTEVNARIARIYTITEQQARSGDGRKRTYLPRGMTQRIAHYTRHAGIKAYVRMHTTLICRWVAVELIETCSRTRRRRTRVVRVMMKWIESSTTRT
jgi:hypothetical protein